MYVLANATDLTIEDMASSAPLASIARSIDFVGGSFVGLFTVDKDGLLIGLLPLGARCERPFLSRRNDSLKDFLMDFLLEIGVSPAAIISVESKTNTILNKNVSLAKHP